MARKRRQSNPDLDEQLLAAASCGDLPGVQAALTAGADVNANLGYALQAGAEIGRLDIVEYLLAAGIDLHDDETYALPFAAQNGHMAVVKCLLAAGVDVHTMDDYALTLAAKGGHLEIVKVLLDAGANVKAEESIALAEAVECGHAAIVRLLRAHGGNPSLIIEDLPDYSEVVQVAVLGHGDPGDLVLTSVAKLGICPEALCALLARQGHGELATMLKATRMLEPLTPDARAEMLAGFLEQHAHAEAVHDHA